MAYQESDENFEAFLELKPVYPDGTVVGDPDEVECFCLEDFKMDAGNYEKDAKRAEQLAKEVGGMVWTVLQSENWVVLAPGLHRMNRDGYVVTSLKSYLPEIVISVFDEDGEDADEDLED